MASTLYLAVCMYKYICECVILQLLYISSESLNKHIVKTTTFMHILLSSPVMPLLHYLTIKNIGGNFFFPRCSTTTRKEIWKIMENKIKYYSNFMKYFLLEIYIKFIRRGELFKILFLIIQ